MDSNTLHGYQLQQHHHQQHNSGLLCFRSAPSSLLENLTPPPPPPPPCSGESEGLVSRFVSYNTDNNNNSSSSNDSVSHSFREFEEVDERGCDSTKGVSLMNSHQQGYGGVGLPPHYPRHGSSSALDGSYGLVIGGSMGMENHKGLFGSSSSSSSSSNLLRQSSSPAGLFSNNISFPNGFATMKGVGNYGAANGSNGELSPSKNRLKNQISFSSRSGSSLGILSQISEIGSEDIGATNPDDGRQGGSNDDATHYGPRFPYGSWNDAPQLSENLTGLKRGQISNEKLFSDVQNEELGNQVHVLSHHLSLPKTSSEIVAMEKLLQFPDSVPCKIRAKRGCATHPRSIAERVRRTRISERMRKLQDLVPNMDKQTNTADMLDLAVDYIKDLQKQFKSLSEKRANCKCISMQKEDTNQNA